jgi:hypothetical protein
MYSLSTGYHWSKAKNPRLRELAEREAYLAYPLMEYAEDEHDGTIEAVFGSRAATLTLGLIDAEANQLFAFGHCVILAWEIHLKTGLPLAVFTSSKASPERWSGHVALHLGGDRFLDIQGVSSLSEIHSRYASFGKYGDFELMNDHDFKTLLVDTENYDDPKRYLCELEQLLLEHFADLVIEENREALESASTAPASVVV